MLKKLMTVKDLAQATGYTRANIWLQIRKGNIKTAFRSDRLCLVSRAEFDRVVELSLQGKYKAFKRISAG